MAGRPASRTHKSQSNTESPRIILRFIKNIPPTHPNSTRTETDNKYGALSSRNFPTPTRFRSLARPLLVPARGCQGRLDAIYHVDRASSVSVRVLRCAGPHAGRTLRSCASCVRTGVSPPREAAARSRARAPRILCGTCSIDNRARPSHARPAPHAPGSWPCANFNPRSPPHPHFLTPRPSAPSPSPVSPRRHPE